MLQPAAAAPPARTAWITGASSGIGRALALALAARGWTVVATARRAELLASLEAEAAGLPGRILAEPGDVTDAPRMAEIGRGDAFGTLSLAVLNAGVSRATDVEQFDAAAMREVIGTNLLGVVNGLGAVVPGMVARGAGRIAIVSSLAGLGGLPRWGAYSASKAALINLASSLRLDLDRRGVTVQVINPGFVRTPMMDGAELRRPFIIPLEVAVTRILRGLESDRFEISFPRRLAWPAKAVNALPYAAYFGLARLAARARRR